MDLAHSAVWQEEADRPGDQFPVSFAGEILWHRLSRPDDPVPEQGVAARLHGRGLHRVAAQSHREPTMDRPLRGRLPDLQVCTAGAGIAHRPIHFYANAGNVLLYLGRWSEAKQALDQAVALSPEDPSVHLALAQFFEQQKQPGDAEREYKASVSLGGELDNLENAWIGLGLFYYSHGRYGEARQAILAAEGLSSIPVSEHSLLGAIDLGLRQPQDALMEFAEAEAIGNRYWQPEDMNRPLFAQIAEGRAAVYAQLGDLQRAIDFEQVATQKTPENAGRWKSLGDLYQRVGQSQLAEQAHERASALSQ